MSASTRAAALADVNPAAFDTFVRELIDGGASPPLSPRDIWLLPAALTPPKRLPRVRVTWPQGDIWCWFTCDCGFTYHLRQRLSTAAELSARAYRHFLAHAGSPL